MVTDSLIITVIGMGFVFVFLGILVAVMELFAYITPLINKFIPEPVVSVKKPAVAAQTSDAAIAAAVALAWYNSKRSK